MVIMNLKIASGQQQKNKTEINVILDIMQPEIRRLYRGTKTVSNNSNDPAKTTYLDGLNSMMKFQMPPPINCPFCQYPPGGHMATCPALAVAVKINKAEDAVNHPAHYNQGEIECIDAIKSMLGQDGFIAYLRGNIAKYNWRLMHKGKALNDAKKIGWYQERLEQELQGAKNVNSEVSDSKT